MKRMLMLTIATGLMSPLLIAPAAVHAGGYLGRWSPPRTGVRIVSPFGFRPHEADNHLPSNVNPSSTKHRKKSHWATPKQMRDNGYRQYGNVRMDNYRNVYIGGKKVGRGKVKKSNRGRYYVDYRTKNGGRIIKQGNGQVWVQPGLQFDNVVTRKNRTGGRNLGTFDINAYRQRRFGN